MARETSMRIEKDLLGEIRVPATAAYGAQTQRAIENFPGPAQRALGQFPVLVQGLIHVKQAVTTANVRWGQLDPAVGEAILGACRDLLEGNHYDQFPIHHLHGGGGTSANMNANEVLANLAEERLGGNRGEYRLVHPNDHVNLNQSTNDVYPTACHVAVLLQWPTLKRGLTILRDQFAAKAEQWRLQKRIARTCLQDAVPITFGDLLGGYAGFLTRASRCVDRAVDALHAVPLGGTIVGRAEDVPSAYFEAVVPALCEATGDAGYRQSDNLFDAAQNLDDLVRVSGELDLLARGLVKICQDLRLMSSGPETGFGEIVLPAVQPGSSIMPGKVNPVIPEFAIQLCFRVMGHHAACQAALDHGELDLNVWESVVVFSILESMELLQSAGEALAGKCLEGMTVDAKRNNQNARTLQSRLTELMKRHGYARVGELCKQAGMDLETLRELLDRTFPEEKEE